MEANVRVMLSENGRATECRRPLEDRKGKETDSSPEPQKEPAQLTAQF